MDVIVLSEWFAKIDRQANVQTYLYVTTSHLTEKEIIQKAYQR
jgi:hypothetical protein